MKLTRCSDTVVCLQVLLRFAPLRQREPTKRVTAHAGPEHQRVLRRLCHAAHHSQDIGFPDLVTDHLWERIGRYTQKQVCPCGHAWLMNPLVCRGPITEKATEQC